MYLSTQETGSPSQLLSSPRSFQRAGREGWAALAAPRPGTKAALCLRPKLPRGTGSRLCSFWVPLVSSQEKHPCLGAGCSQRAEARPSPSRGTHVSIPAALPDAKSSLALPNCPVTFASSRVWQPTISSQTGELTAASNLCQSSTHVTGEQAVLHPRYKGPICTAKQTKSTCLQHCGRLAPLSLVKDAEGTRARADLLGSARQESAGPHDRCCRVRAQPSRTSSNSYSKPGAREISFWNFSLSFLCSCCSPDSHCLSSLIWLQKIELDGPRVTSAHQTACPVTVGNGWGGGKQNQNGQAPLLALPLAGFCVTAGRALDLPIF